MIKQLAHLCVFTHQFNAMIVFYRDTLGLPVAFTLDAPDGTPFGYYFACGESTFIELFDREKASKVWGGSSDIIRGNHMAHFCFQMTDMVKYRELLVSKGIAVSEITMGMDHSYQCWIKDPDGNDIELMEYTDASLQVL